MQEISILGCGWLGLPLAKTLLTKGYSVKGSTTSEGKLTIIESHGIRPFLISLSQQGIQGEIEDFLNHSKILIIDIPPKLRGAEKESFVVKIQNLIPYIESANVSKVIFISSTSVYADDNTVVTEATVAVPDTESGAQLLQAELSLRNNKHFVTTIIRFSGLIGDDRHPVHFLAGRADIENPNGPVNFIHQQDCIGIILRIIEKDCWNQVFNAATPYHPNREAYYTQKALAAQLIPPVFNHEKKSVGKTIASTKLEHELGYRFLVTNTI